MNEYLVNELCDKKCVAIINGEDEPSLEQMDTLNSDQYIIACYKRVSDESQVQYNIYVRCHEVNDKAVFYICPFCKRNQALVRYNQDLHGHANSDPRSIEIKRLYLKHCSTLDNRYEPMPITSVRPVVTKSTKGAKNAKRKYK